jgi:4-hydroxy-tetrahydrodipicolinate reductase
MAVRIAVAGGLGRMGSEIVKLALAKPEEFEVVAVGAEEKDPHAGRRLSEALAVKSDAEVLGEEALKAALKGRRFDVLIDVTGAESGVAIMRASIEARAKFVSGSTGIATADLDAIAAAARAAGVAGVWTPNFSVGVNVWWSLLDKAARALPGYDIEVVEVHHNQKKDAPSGTAAKAVDVLKAAGAGPGVMHGRQGIVGARGGEIGVHAVRLGDVVGEHTAFFGANAERIEITHRAHSRVAFAAGALTAARWVAAKHEGGLFSMAHVLGVD